MSRNRARLFLVAGLASAAIALSLALGISGPAHQGPQYLPTSLSDPPASSSVFSRFSVFAIPQPAPAAQAAPVSTNSANSVYFRQTAHYVKDAFLNYWLMNGGVQTYGYPISEEFVSNGVPVQYFERSRFEYHASSGRPWHVDLSNAGTLLTSDRTFPPATQTDSGEDHAYFEQTGHSLGGQFYQYWQASGGLAIFGYPISEELQENGSSVQYFERARFELTGQGRVQLGRLGAELLSKDIAAGLDPSVAAPQTRPGFNMSFRGNATWFHANWDRVISLNKQWGNLPQDYVGRGLYAAAPADLGLYGRWARVTRGNRSIFVQFVDVINWPDIPYVRDRGIVIDLGEESYRALGTTNGSRYDVNFDVLWPGDEP